MNKCVHISDKGSIDLVPTGGSHNLILLLCSTCNSWDSLIPQLKPKRSNKSKILSLRYCQVDSHDTCWLESLHSNPLQLYIPNAVITGEVQGHRCGCSTSTGRSAGTAACGGLKSGGDME